MLELNELPTFKDFVSEKLKLLSLKFILIFSLVFILGSLVPVVLLKVKNERLSIQPVATYLENLVRTNDRIELQKILKSISISRNTKIDLINDGKIFSLTENLERLDQPFIEPVGYRIFGINFSPKYYNINVPLNDNTFVYISCSYQTLIKDLLTYLTVFLWAIGIFAHLYLKRVNALISESLMPLNDLEKDISGLLDGKILKTEKQRIIELEKIRTTIIKTNNELENAKETLAIEKAKKLNAEAYKKLIHDLHNPVSSLQNTVSAINDPYMDYETKKEIINMIPNIADQLLSQVVAAKRNLDFDSVNLQKRDVKECLNQCIALINGNNKKGKTIVLKIDDEKLIIPHDPILLQRAILNLMENGLEFSKAKIELKAIKNNDHVSIVVSDDGDGMKREDVPVFFQGRGKSSRAERQAFGLSSANHIARVHGGKLIYAKNEMGGASFELRLSL